jgi:hypothetical protein
MSGTVTRIHAELADPAQHVSPPVPPRCAELDLEAACGFLVELDGRMQDANAAQLAYLLGLAEGHLSNLIDLVRRTIR